MVSYFSCISSEIPDKDTDPIIFIMNLMLPQICFEFNHLSSFNRNDKCSNKCYCKQETQSTERKKKSKYIRKRYKQITMCGINESETGTKLFHGLFQELFHAFFQGLLHEAIIGNDSLRTLQYKVISLGKILQMQVCAKPLA